MVTTPEVEESPTTEDKIKAATRSVIAGHPQGAVRRIVLWVLAFALAGTAMLTAYAVVPLLVVLALLAATDQLA
jgi:hypothetical protein